MEGAEVMHAGRGEKMCRDLVGSVKEVGGEVG
jgi:hypothetical protein